MTTLVSKIFMHGKLYKHRKNCKTHNKNTRSQHFTTFDGNYTELPITDNYTVGSQLRDLCHDHVIVNFRFGPSC